MRTLELDSYLAEPVEEGESWGGFALSPLWGVKEELVLADEAYRLARLQEGGGR